MKVNKDMINTKMPYFITAAILLTGYFLSFLMVFLTTNVPVNGINLFLCFIFALPVCIMLFFTLGMLYLLGVTIYHVVENFR